jgi:hypothetical protein
LSTPRTAVDVVQSLCCRRGRHAVHTAKARPGSEGIGGIATLGLKVKERKERNEEDEKEN